MKKKWMALAVVRCGYGDGYLRSLSGGGFMFFAPFVILVLIMPLESSFKIGLALGGTVTFLVGFWDDAISLSPFQKLAGQSLGAAVYILIRGSSGILSGIALFCWLV